MAPWLFLITFHFSLLPLKVIHLVRHEKARGRGQSVQGNIDRRKQPLRPQGLSVQLVDLISSRSLSTSSYRPRVDWNLLFERI